MARDEAKCTLRVMEPSAFVSRFVCANKCQPLPAVVVEKGLNVARAVPRIGGVAAYGLIPVALVGTGKPNQKSAMCR